MKKAFTKPLRYVFYDLESTGVNTQTDQPVQVCMIETDGDLNILTDENGQPLIHDFKIMLRPDIIPSPEAFMVHKIRPTTLYGKPSETLLTEFDAAEKIKSILSRTPNTCIAGFNNLSFDDEMIRNVNFRNLLDPYEHEWKQENHRTDIYHLLILTRMFSESAINWHTREDGTVSLKLEDTCKANGITHGASHDAKNDVLDTIALARLIKERKPDLFFRFKGMSDKSVAQDILNSQGKFVLTSKYLSRDTYNSTIAYPVKRDRVNKNRYYAIDLTQDLSFLLNGSYEDIMSEIFTANSDKTHTPIPTGIQTITINKVPMISKPTPLDGESPDAGFMRVAKKAGIDYELVRRNEELVRANFVQIQKVIENVFQDPPKLESKDVYTSLYTGDFMDDAERSLRERQRLPILINGQDGSNTQSNYLVGENVVDKFRFFKKSMDVHAQLILRAKWNNNFRTLLSRGNIDNIDPNELIIFQHHLKNALFNENSGLGLTVKEYHQRVGQVKLEWDLTQEDIDSLDELDRHVDRTIALYKLITKKCHELKDKAAQLREGRIEDYKKCFTSKFRQATFEKESTEPEMQ